MPNNDEKSEIQNLKEVIEYSENYIKTNRRIDLVFVNNIHKKKSLCFAAN